jgi:hypothetical protein
MTFNRMLTFRMHRRHLLATLAAGSTPFMTQLSDAAVQPLLQALKPSPRMPVLFVGHGSPMNAIEDNTWRRTWQAMGTELLKRPEAPQLILCISAHWLTDGGWQLTGMARSPRRSMTSAAFRRRFLTSSTRRPVRRRWRPRWRGS